VDAAGDLVYVGAESSGLQIIDMSDPVSPTVRGSYTETDATTCEVEVGADLAYVTMSTGLRILNIADPTNPTLLGQVPIGCSPILVVDETLYTAGQIFDVGDPANPQPLGSFSSQPMEGVKNIFVSGDRIYLASSGYTSGEDYVKNGLTILDAGSPSAPTLLGAYSTTGQALDVHVEGDLAYIADSNFKQGHLIQIVDVSNPAAPLPLLSHPIPGSPSELQLVGDLLVVAAGEGGLMLFRASTPDSPPGTITPQGGSFVSGDGRIALQFPANAVAGPITIAYAPIITWTHSLGDGWGPLLGFSLEARDGAGQPVTQFQQPYTLVISYTDAALAAAGVDEQDLNVAFWNGSAWVEVLPCDGCAVDAANNRVTVKLDHFTEFALVAQVERKVFLPLMRR
jgi:hypothetical protein